MSGSKRKSSGSSDFKRIKAKVGKKTQRQNDTDVSFQSASLHLGQSIPQNNELQKSTNLQLLLSSRGKSLYDLVSTASTHPAAAARASSLKGVLDIVKNHPPDALLPNLSTLIPACVHSCVDEDQDVRSVGIDVLSALLSQLQEKRIQPFGALLVARISSALHSLDASTRIDGVKMAKLISTTCPSLTSTFVAQLLPPFSGLLGDQRTRKSIDEILQSLISLLRVNTTKYPGVSATMSTSRYGSSSYAGGDVQASRKNDYKPDLIYIPGGRSRNAISRTGRSLHDLPNTIVSISQLPRLENPTVISLIVERKIKNSDRRGKYDGLGIQCKISLFSKLRDSLIESINLEHEPTMASTNRMARSKTIEPQVGMNHSRVILLLRSIRYLHKSFVTNNVGISDDDDTEFGKFTQQIVAVLIDIFPIDQDPSAITATKDSKSTSIDDVNAAVAITILDVSHDPRTNNEEVENTSAMLNDANSKHWMKTICSYLFPRINNLVQAPSATSSSDLDITCKILRRLGMDRVFAADLNFVLGILQDLFFPTKDTQLARSTAGRRISLIVMDLIEDTNFSLGNESTSSILPISGAFIQFVMTMPFYLEAWAADFVYESQRILKGLHKLVREVKESCNSPVLESIRESWYKLVTDRGDSSSIFEMYPWHLQKMYLGLVVLLRNPRDQTLRNLAFICGRSILNSDSYVRKEATAQAIVEAIQKIRKTVSMQNYLTFLVQSVGIPRHVKEVLRVETIAADANLDLCPKDVFDRAFFTADPALNRVARVLIQSGSMQVLRMILPQISSWQQTKVEEGGSSMEFLLKTRASHIILAHFFLLHTKQKNQLADQSSLFDLTHGVMTVDTVKDSICRVIHWIVRNEEAMNFSSKLTSPIIAIISSEHVVLNAVVLKMTDWLLTAGLSKTEQKNVLLILIDWMNDPRLKDALTGSSPSAKIILKQIHTISRSVVLQDNELVLNLVSILTTK